MYAAHVVLLPRLITHTSQPLSSFSDLITFLVHEVLPCGNYNFLKDLRSTCATVFKDEPGPLGASGSRTRMMQGTMGRTYVCICLLGN